MTPLAQAISVALVQFVWQGFLVWLLVSAAMFVLRKSGPHVRYLVYSVALCVLAVLPVFTAAALYDPLAAHQPGAAAITLTIRAVWNGSVSPAARFMERWLNASQPGLFQLWVLRIWILGVAFLSLRLAWLGTRVSSLRRSGKPAGRLILALSAALARRMGMRRAVRVLISAIPDGPSVVGWFRPVILLPAATILNLAPDQLEAILAHELAHLRRYDDVVNIAQSVIETLLFYHPAVWWISNRIRHERELCCDDLAVRACGNALCYARALTALERLRIAPPVMALGAAGSPLEYRIRRIVGAQTRDYQPSRLPGILALGMTLACLAICSIPAHGSPPSPPERVEYPESARVNGIQGTVPVEVKIDDLGRVAGAKAMGGPRELRQAAVESASALRFAPDTIAGTEQVNVAFQLVPPAAPASNAAPLSPVPHAASARAGEAQTRTGPGWIDEGESDIGMAAANEKDPSRRLELLRQWEQQYPSTEFRDQRTSMTAQALLAVLGAANGKTDPAVLDAGRQAGRQLVDHFSEYFNDSLKGPSTTPDEWAKERTASEFRIHTVLAYIAQTGKDDATAEAELKKALAIDPEEAPTSYQLGATIIREMATGNQLTRYSEAIYDFARSLTVTGPNALSPEMKAAAENALKESYGNYHGSADGLDELMKLVGVSALPPPDFHIASVVELNEPVRRSHAAWAAAHPDLDLWEKTKASVLEHGEAYLATLRNAVLPAMFHATVVAQPSSSRLVVNVDNVPAGDAILKFDGDNIRAVRPGTRIGFRGVADSYTQDPYVLTFVIRNPKSDITGLDIAPKRGILARIFRGLVHAVRRLA